MSELSSAKKFQFVGGNLALDFCNTVGGKRGSVTREYLTSCLEYVAWCHQAGLLGKTEAEACLELSHRDAVQGAEVLARAVELREALFRVFAAVIASKDPLRADLAVLNEELARSLGRLRLTGPREGCGFAWEWVGDRGSLDQPLGPIAHAAATLLADRVQLPDVKMCQGDTCGWLFSDSSRNHSRRWCDMRDCGNRAKVRRHRLKQHLTAGGCGTPPPNLKGT